MSEEPLRFAGAAHHDLRIDGWLNSPPNAELGALATRWFRRIRECDGNVRELLHDGVATVCVNDAPFAYVGMYKAHVSLGFFRGAELPDPAGLLEGSGRHMRHVKLRPGFPIDDAALNTLIAVAYDHMCTLTQRARDGHAT